MSFLLSLSPTLLLLTIFLSGFANASNPIDYPVFSCAPGAYVDSNFNKAYLSLPADKIFESGQVRPLALSPENLPAELSEYENLVFVANTPRNCLEIYSHDQGVGNDSLTLVSAIAVGAEPVSVNTRVVDKDGLKAIEAWVVNHISDSISVVEIANNQAPQIVSTLRVGDEPRDVVFAGSTERAFIATAARGVERFQTMEPLRTGVLNGED